MASIPKPEWWNIWVIQGLYTTILREDAPRKISREFNRFLRTQQMVKL